MKKNILKVALITLSVISLSLALYFFTDSISTCPSTAVTVPSFDTYVQNKVSQELEGHRYEEARIVFDSLLIDIFTETVITRGDGTKNIEDTEINRSKLILFSKYVPIFNVYCNSQFQKNRWNRDTLNHIRTEAKSLLDMNVADSNTSPLINTLKATVGVVNDYYSAWTVVNSASQCTTVSSIEDVKRKADKYNISPLTNDTQLRTSLSSVEQVAKDAVVRVIVNLCSNTAQGWKNYTDYNEWNQAYGKGSRRIKEYKDKYGMNPSLSIVQQQLDNADRSALPYYTQQQNNQ